MVNKLSIKSYKTAIATAWDPSSPASLLIAPNTKKLNQMLASDGLGCTPEEISALLELLDARDKLEDEFEDFFFRMDDQMKLSHLFQLSTKYIQKIHQCVSDWSDRISNTDSDTGVPETETQNLNFLIQMHSVLHLSSIYLLSPYFSISDTVKFLRYHFVPNPLEEFSEDMNMKTDEVDAIEQMLASPQPEYYEGGTPYWLLLERLIQRGMLKDAWAVLSNHSVCRACSKDTATGLEEEEEMEQARLGFSQMYALLHSAPIPGGHTSDNDMDFDSDNAGVTTLENGLDDNILLDGVPTYSFQYWESEETSHAAYSHWMTWNAAVQSMLQNGIEGGLHKRIPQLMTSILAILAGQQQETRDSNRNSKGQIWAEILLQEILYTRPNMTANEICVRANAAMRAAKIGKSDNSTDKSGLESIVLSVMRGDAGRAIEASHILGGGSGAALPSTMCALLCDLLTHANLLHPIDSFGADSNSIDYHIELLLSAASACQSSFATSPTVSVNQKYHYKQIGVQCAIRILRYTHHIRGIATIFEMVSSLDQSKATDMDISSILKLCDYRFTGELNGGTIDEMSEGHEPFILIDTYIDICLARARYHLRHSRPAGATYWCLLCVQFELKSCSYSKHSNGKGKRLLEQICHAAATNLLKGVSLVFECCTVDDLMEGEDIVKILQQNLIVKNCLAYACETWNAIEKDEIDDDIDMKLLLQHLSADELVFSSLSLLKNVIKLTTGFVQKDEMQVLKATVYCLKESEKGTGVSIASLSLWPRLLNLAFVALWRQEQKSFEHSGVFATNILTVEDVQTLTESLTTLAATNTNFISATGSFFTEEKMRSLLMKALMNAFVAENKLKEQVKEKKNQTQFIRQKQMKKDTSENIYQTVERHLCVPGVLM